MTNRTRVLLVSLGVACVAAAPTTSPIDALLKQLTSRPGVTTRDAATTRALATVDAAAEPILAKLNTAYAGGPLTVEAELVGVFDVAGRSRTYRLAITGQTDGNGRFVHDAASAGRIVAGEKRGVVFDRRRNAFATFDAPGARVPAADLEPALIDVLLDENPALLFGLVTDPDATLRMAAQRIRPATRPSTSRPAGDGVVLELEDKTIELNLNADGTVGSSVIDYTPLMTTRRAVAVKAAAVTLTYRSAKPVAPSTDVYTWEPPATATEFALHDEMIQTTRPATRPSRRPQP